MSTKRTPVLRFTHCMALSSVAVGAAVSQIQKRSLKHVHMAGASNVGRAETSIMVGALGAREHRQYSILTFTDRQFKPPVHQYFAEHKLSRTFPLSTAP